MARHFGLRYTASAAPVTVQGQPAALAPEILAVLPEQMRGQLRNAVIALDVKRIKAVIRQIAEHEPAAGSALAAYADRFAYTAILQALEDGRTDRRGAKA
jgi:hypothetical protein